VEIEEFTDEAFEKVIQINFFEGGQESFS